MASEQMNDGSSAPFINIQSEPDYSDDSSNDYLQSIPSNSSKSSVFDSNYTTTNTNNNTFFSNIFKNNIKTKSYETNQEKKKNKHENNEAQSQNVHQLHVIHSELESSAESEIDIHQGSNEQEIDTSFNRLRSESSDNESMKLFRENIHLLEEQPISDGYEPEDNIKQNTFNINDIDKKQLTLWRFSNIDNLDSFFITFYKYYLKKGLYSFLLEKIINLIILVFVLNVSLTMKFCIDYEKFAFAIKLQDIWVDKCYKEMPFVIKLLKFIVYAFLTLKSFAIYKEFKTMQLMNNFYYYLLEIDDHELQIISWVEVLNRLVKFKDTNNLFKDNNNVTFENIVSRIMRYDNYLIAMYSNETLFKFSLFKGKYKIFLTKSLEWNLNLIIMNFFFANGHLINLNNKKLLELDLIKKFRVAGFINILLTPFLIIYFTLLYLLKYFYNIKSIFNSREYNLENKYKLREYNELEHFFTKRLNLSIDIANEYLLQFPNNVTNLIYKFLAFISGSLLAILTITTLVADSENFLSFEVTKNKSILFYISIIGALNTFTYNNIQQDKYKTYQPKMYFKELVKYTHFVPVAKDNKPLFNIEIRDQFNEVYSLKLINIIHEFASLLLTPYILWFVLPKRSKNIIAFMESITEKDNDLGFICKFANYKPEHEDTKKSFYYMHKEDLSQHEEPEHESFEKKCDSPKISSIDVKDLKYDNKRRIKDKLLRQEQMNYKTHRNRNTKINNGYNLNYNSIMNFNGEDDSDNDIFENLQGDKMMRSFMQFKRVYHNDK
ncbi:uncharacterized protein HGUI_00862 [Hanseniaspora guilliermondii]|uniref:Autophagy-related protein 9 n=1 Tax=Hanseniaspora guilliermondii TaxID=56406 RepID=A0A1L0FGE7_9ASCO|nr:uncharacterized protein HGUI_00862 [Hanseniaspora guilliermondii]